MKTNGTHLFLVRSIIFILLLLYFAFVVSAKDFISPNQYNGSEVNETEFRSWKSFASPDTRDAPLQRE